MLKQKGRRHFLVGAGGAALALPFMPSLLPRTARAETTPAPRRFIALLSHHNYCGHHWLPPLAGATSRQLPGVQLKELDLGALTGPINPVLDHPEMQRLRRKITLVDGLSCWEMPTNHPGNMMLGMLRRGSDGPLGSGMPAADGNETIDVILSRSKRLYASEPVARSVDFAGVYYNGENTNKMSVQRTGDKLFKVEHNTNLNKLWSKLFGSLTAGSGATATGPSPNEKMRFLVDRVLESFNTLANGPRLARDDRAVLQEHVESIHSLQKSLAAIPQTPPNCARPQVQLPTQPIGGIASPYGGALKPDDVFRLAVKIVAAGMRCDLTRVATINLSPDRPDNWNAGGFHGICHDTGLEGVKGVPPDGPNQSGLLAAQRWQASLVADLMRELDGFTDANGLSALDNSLIFWSNAMGDVERLWRDGHGGLLLRAFFAGSAGGAVNTGRFLQYYLEQMGTYPGYEKVSGPLWNHLMISILRAFGLPNAEFQTDSGGGFGAYGAGSDTLFKNTFRAFVNGINNDRGAVLPGFLRA